MAAAALNRRRIFLFIAVGLSLALLLTWSARLVPSDSYYEIWQSAKGSISGASGDYSSQQPSQTTTTTTQTALSPHVEKYFEQVFSPDRPPAYPFEALKDACNAAPWPADDADAIYLKCGGMSAGMTSIMSQIKVCLKMAVETGSHLVLPAMPLRDSEHLLEYNFANVSAYLNYDEWFDADHLREQLRRACPRMKVVHPVELDKTLPVKHTWSVLCSNAWNYRPIHPYFWVGRPYKNFFADQLRMLRAKAAAEPDAEQLATKAGITVIEVDSEFLLFRITDDPTGRDLRFWTDLSHLIRFRDAPRQLVRRLVDRLGDRPYIGVHFRVENDSIWSSFDNQLKRDLDALDRAWERDRTASGMGGDAQRPLVYIACGDEGQIERFVAAGVERGWEVTHKWKLARDDSETTRMIDELAFDFQGAVDMGLMLRSRFFLGVGGSAFSSTVANHRDRTGRYRGSSFELADDEGARNHLFNDLDADEYACCL